MNTRTALLGSQGVSTGVALRQHVQQCLRLLQISGVKALGEPAVDGCQQLVGLGTFALLLPQPAQASGSTQLPGFGLLTAGNGERVVETVFCCSILRPSMLAPGLE